MVRWNTEEKECFQKNPKVQTKIGHLYFLLEVLATYYLLLFSPFLLAYSFFYP